MPNTRAIKAALRHFKGLWRHHGVTVNYTQDGTVYQFEAVKGQRQTVLSTPEGATQTQVNTDFMFRWRDLDGQRVVPQPFDRIEYIDNATAVESDGQPLEHDGVPVYRGTLVVCDVGGLGLERCYQFSEQDRTLVRVHATEKHADIVDLTGHLPALTLHSNGAPITYDGFYVVRSKP